MPLAKAGDNSHLYKVFVHPTNAAGLSENRHVRLVDVVDIVVKRLDPLATRAKEPVPHARLLAVVLALSPALAVMQIMVLDAELHV